MLHVGGSNVRNKLSLLKCVLLRAGGRSVLNKLAVLKGRILTPPPCRHAVRRGWRSGVPVQAAKRYPLPQR